MTKVETGNRPSVPFSQVLLPQHEAPSLLFIVTMVRCTNGNGELCGLRAAPLATQGMLTQHQVLHSFDGLFFPRFGREELMQVPRIFPGGSFLVSFNAFYGPCVLCKWLDLFCPSVKNN